MVLFFDRRASGHQVTAQLVAPEDRPSVGQVARALTLVCYDLRSVCLPRQMRWVDELAPLFLIQLCRLAAVRYQI